VGSKLSVQRKIPLALNRFAVAGPWKGKRLNAAMVPVHQSGSGEIWMVRSALLLSALLLSALLLPGGRDVRAPSLSGFDRCCRKKILGGSSRNIDSRRASNAQDRFKNPACAILLLRVVRVAPTFSTASVTKRLEASKSFPLYPHKRKCLGGNLLAGRYENGTARGLTIPLVYAQSTAPG
jgi:hypothetical protein